MTFLSGGTQATGQGYASAYAEFDGGGPTADVITIGPGESECVDSAYLHGNLYTIFGEVMVQVGISSLGGSGSARGGGGVRVTMQEPPDATVTIASGHDYTVPEAPHALGILAAATTLAAVWVRS